VLIRPPVRLSRYGSIFHDTFSASHIPAGVVDIWQRDL